MENRVIIRSYSKVWKVENRIYAIQNIVLPFPINPREILYFGIAAAGVFILGVILPPFKAIPVILRYGAIPIGLTKLLNKKKFDGKSPPKYLAAYIGYLFSRRDYVERFKTHPHRDNEKIKLDWWCSYVPMSD